MSAFGTKRTLADVATCPLLQDSSVHPFQKEASKIASARICVPLGVRNCSGNRHFKREPVTGLQRDPSMTGIHHVTAISGKAARNLEFYTHVLGLRFVKKTVNFDGPALRAVVE